MHRRVAFVLATVLFGAQVAVVPRAEASQLSPSRATQIGRHVVMAVSGGPHRIPVAEPVRRTPPPRPPDSSFRAMLSKDVHRPSGRRLLGPPMLPPSEVARIVAAGPVQARQRSIQLIDSTQLVTRFALPGRARGAAAPGKPQTRATQSIQASSGTGINPWWRYQEETIPGGGHVMVNVGTGNVLIQDDDMVVPHKGVALTFRRTYNSQSLHTVAGGGAEDNGHNWTGPGMYGNGWTNTFDAHMVTLSPTIRSVYDVDGARYDYVLPANPSWTSGMILHSATPGNFDYVQYDGSCGWIWIKKTGTMYYFYLTDPGSNCPALAPGTLAGYSGRLRQIIGRNNYNNLTFAYSWDNGDATAGGKVSAISVQAESGMTANLAFADVSGHRLLQSITFPDNATTVAYGYDTLGNLVNVSRPPNNSFGDRPSHSYGYVQQGSGGSIIGWADSPRWAKGGGDGNVTSFAFTGNSPATATLNAMSRYANVNPVIADGSNSGPLQAGYSTAAYEYYDEYYTTGVPTPTFRDTDGHATNWVADSQGRVTQTQECVVVVNQTCGGNPLVTNDSWDASNNLLSEVDPRNGETDYAYDVDGNTVAVAQPPPSPGAFRPTSLYTYGAYDNLVAYCDPVFTHGIQADWTTPPAGPIPVGGGACPTQGSANWRMGYSYPWYEPFGELTAVTTPTGYTRSYSYAAGQQGGNDYGLPTSVTGTGFSQTDGTSITPTQTFWYDASGYVRCYSKGQGNTVLSYDALGRITSIADPDDSSANGTSLCAKSSGQPGWNTQTTRTYFPDGTVQSSQTPAERAGGVASYFTYDLDGNPTTETHHFGCTSGSTCTAGVTTKWYDGRGRLVEVGLPHDPSDYYSTPWLTRYLYDLSAGASVAIGTTGYQAHGNLFKTQEWIGGTPASWTDTSGQAFDGLDRAVTKYNFSPSSNTTVRATAMVYDGTAATLGLLTSTTDPLGETKTFAYDALGHLTSVQFTGDGGVTPNKSFAYDADGREVSASSTVYGTETTRYDADGHVVEVDEPTTGSMTSPGRITYDYYPDGEQKDVNVASSALNASPLLSYAYRTDGRRSRVHLGYGQRQGDFTSTYTDGGRPMSQSDPFTGTLMPSPQAPVAAGTLYAPRTIAYDAYGQLTQVQLPETLAYSVLHDDEGDVTSFTASNSTNGPLTMNYSVTVRGENIGQGIAPSAPQSLARIANGLSVPVKIAPGGTGKRPEIAVVDPKNAVISAWTYESYIPYNDPNSDPSSGYADCGPMTDAQDYDAASRLLGHTLSGPGSSDPHCADIGATYGPHDDYAYDAENHHIGAKGGSWSSTGHLYNAGGMSIHYDAETPLFGTDAQGHVWVKIEALADIDSSGQLTVWDRDYAELLQTGHNNVAYFNINIGNVVLQAGKASTIFKGSANAVACPAAGGACVGGAAQFLPYNRLEGFDYAGLTFQGVRAVETASGQWTTPDAYAGDIHDPASQKRFMWDRNNPYQYSDPSGYYAGIPDAAGQNTFSGWGTADWWKGQNGGSEGSSETDSDKASGDIAYAGRPKPADEEPKQPSEKTKKQSKKSGKERSSQRPSWVAYMKDPEPKPGESGNDYATRMIHEKYEIWDRRYWDTGPKSEYNQIRKWFDRGKK
jgi:YD repeat-containing protein